MSVEAAASAGVEGARSGPFKPAVVVGLVGVAVFALASMGVLSAYAPDLRDGDDGQAHALSKSAVGYAGLVRLLEETGRDPVMVRGPGELTPNSLTIVTPLHGVSREPLEALAESDRALLYVLPKWNTTPDPVRPGWVRAAGRLPPMFAAAVLPDMGDVTPGAPGDDPRANQDADQDLAVVAATSALAVTEVEGDSRPSLRTSAGAILGRPDQPIEGLRTLSGEGWRPVILDEAGRALVVTHDETGSYVLAEPDLLNTQGMADLGRARAAVAMLDYLAGDAPLVFDLTAAGFSRPRSLLRLMLEPPLLGFSLCLFAAFLLVGWGALVRFGPHRRGERVVPLGKRALADNTAALISLAGKEHRLAGPYARLTRAAALKAVAAPADGDETRQTALLDRLAEAGGSPERWTALNDRALTTRTPKDLMALARALTDWKTSMTKGRPS
ncbi:hypothetical protein [Brevundimonas lutea]|uniref:hypothetical protein n=1 Tax=Brevundimonas lutea TaxID=2293980 RepID=UPI000F025B7C|nr:hypothetical protein [Brevundimonas lutea]